MKAKISASKSLSFAAGAWVCCALNLAAQTPPTIATQLTNQTVFGGTNMSFSVTVAGTGPFSYQWQFDGTNLPNNIITTVAGNGSMGYSGDGGAATNASLDGPYDVALDASGNLIIADYLNNRIRKVAASGVITTVAGNGSMGYSGDGGAATSASLYYPFGASVDASSNLFIADYLNNRIRKVGPNGVITTVAGNGNANYSGDGGAATSASLYYPSSVAADASGNLYIADYNNQRIRKVDTNGVITTVAGNGAPNYSGDGGAATNASLYYPCGVAVDGHGNLYLADSYNNRLRKVDASGVITTVAGNGAAAYAGDGGAATRASLSNPSGVAVDAFGNLYIADQSNNRIRKVDTNGIISTVAGNGSAAYAGDGGAATNASLNSPSGVAVDASGNLSIADYLNNRTRGVPLAGHPILPLPSVSSNNAGSYTVVIASPYGSVTSAVAALTVVYPPAIVVQPASQGVLAGSNVTLSVTATGTPSLYYSWYLNATNLVQSGTSASLILNNMNAGNAGQYTVVVTNAYGAVTSQIATLAFPPALAAQPVSQTVLPGTSPAFGVTVSGVGPFTYLWQFNGANLPSDIITTVAGNGFDYSGDGGAATNAGVGAPFGVALDAAGNLYIADYVDYRIRKVDTNGIITTVAGNGTAGYSGDGGAATKASLDYPFAVAVDAAGNLYIADSENNRIRKVATNGIITTLAGNGTGGYSGDGGAAAQASLLYPYGVAVDASGNVYIADSDNDRVRKVDTNGIITTVAGDATPGYSGDGGLATKASLEFPVGVGLDSSGNLYIADFDNSRVRKVGANGIITTFAGNGTEGFAGDGGAATNAGLYYPVGVAADASGNVFIADYYDFRIREVDPHGVITTVAGNGIATFAGDGGPATKASLSYPIGVAVDASGNVYISDEGNNRVREVFLSFSYPALRLNDVDAFNAGNYTVVVTSPYGSVTSAVATLTVETPPVITVAPVSQVVLAGTNVTWTAAAAGSQPFCFCWYDNATNLIQSGTNTVLTLTGVSLNDAGSYTAVVSNAYGSVTSAVATLTVWPMVVTNQPVSQSAPQAGNATFAVGVGGAGPFWYSWYLNSTNLVQAGASPTLTVAGLSLSTAGDYTVVITNAYGAATSAVATLSVMLPPFITIGPSNQFVLPGAAAAFSVTTGYTAGPFSYQWRLNGANLPNNTISTVAGNGTAGYSGDGGWGTNAKLSSPYGAALDASGNLYIADRNNNRIRKVTTNGVITTVAGNGAAAYAGDGAAATKASLAGPAGVAFDAAGSLYIADQGNNRIRKMDTSGIITTVAGNGTMGCSGDGGTATSASLDYPRGVALDSAGNLFVADLNNQRVRKVDANGVITTVAGNGNAGFSGDGGAATNASLFYPAGVALDAAGNLYIADEDNNRIRKVDAYGIISTVAGNGSGTCAGDGGAAISASMGLPDAVAFDSFGNLYVADYNNHRVRRVDTNGLIATVAGNGVAGFSGNGGAATNASLDYPAGVALDSAGNLYIADGATNRVRKVLQRAGYPTLPLLNVGTGNAGSYTVVVTTPYGSVTSAVAALTVVYPPSILVQPASQFVVAGNISQFSVSVAGTGPFEYLWYFAGTNLIQSGSNSTLTLPAVSTNDDGDYTVLVTNGYGGVTSQVATLTVGFPPSVTTQPVSRIVPAQSNATFSVVAGGTGPLSYQWRCDGSNFPNNIITTVAGNGNGAYAGDGGAATNASLCYPETMAVDSVGNLYVADTGNNRIRKVATNGIITTVAGNGSGTYAGDGGAATNAGINYPYGVAVDSAGNLFIADTYNNCIREVAGNGIITTVAGNGSGTYAGDGGAATNASLYYPYGVSVDAAGNLYIADTDNNAIRKVATNGIITTVAGNGAAGFSGDGGAAANASLNSPESVALDAAGNLYVADFNNQRVRKIATNGIITTVAGNGANGYSGDGAAAADASLAGPPGLALDAFGNLYIADEGNNRIRKVDTGGIITTVAGNGSGAYAGDGGPAVSASLNYPSGVALDVSGNLYIGDQANQCIRKVLLYAGYTAFTLNDVCAANAGLYTVVITSPYGSVTSAVVALNVGMTPPQIIACDASFGFLTNQFGFHLSGAAGQIIVVDGSTNLVDWTPLCTNAVGASPYYFCDPCYTNFGSRFYRLRLP